MIWVEHPYRFRIEAVNIVLKKLLVRCKTVDVPVLSIFDRFVNCYRKKMSTYTFVFDTVI